MKPMTDEQIKAEALREYPQEFNHTRHYNIQANSYFVDLKLAFIKGANFANKQPDINQQMLEALKWIVEKSGGCNSSDEFAPAYIELIDNVYAKAYHAIANAEKQQVSQAEGSDAVEVKKDFVDWVILNKYDYLVNHNKYLKQFDGDTMYTIRELHKLFTQQKQK